MQSAVHSAMQSVVSDALSDIKDAASVAGTDTGHYRDQLNRIASRAAHRVDNQLDGLFSSANAAHGVRPATTSTNTAFLRDMAQLEA